MSLCFKPGFNSKDPFLKTWLPVMQFYKKIDRKKINKADYIVTLNYAVILM